MIRLATSSAEETAKAGYKLGSLLNPGDLVCLTGDLGTGKTAFTGGIAHALGIEGYITSPTFTIVNEYMGKLPLYHFDAYRICDADEMFEIGFEEYLDSRGVVVIEWAEQINDILPENRVRVNIRKDLKTGPDVRIIEIHFDGPHYMQYEESYGNENTGS